MSFDILHHSSPSAFDFQTRHVFKTSFNYLEVTPIRFGKSMCRSSLGNVSCYISLGIETVTVFHSCQV
jgi:hypothetical protein